MSKGLFVVEIRIRETCPDSYEMSDGGDGYTLEHKLPCATCQNTGYVERWVAPKELVAILLDHNQGDRHLIATART